MAVNVSFGKFDSETEKQSDIIVGIDLGTTNSLVAICENGTPHVLTDANGIRLIPSVVHWNDSTHNILVGNEAKPFRITDAQHTAYSVKRFIGKGKADLDPKSLAAVDTSLSTENNVVIRLGEKTFSAVELSSEVLKKLKTLAESSLKQSVNKAVVTVPAYFNDAQRQATKTAGQLAGLEVVRIVNEPTAAALAYGLDKKKNGLIAVYDLGGGTFDISLLRLHDGIFEVLSTGGDTALGGDDFDQVIVASIAAEIKKSGAPDFKADDLNWKATLIEAAEKIKIALSQKNEITSSFVGADHKTYSVTITAADFERDSLNLVERTLKIAQNALDDAKLQAQDIGDVVMVGGSTRLPLVRKKVRDFFGRDLNTSVNPDEVVALGAAIQADILAGKNQDMVLLDIVPLSLGIETYGGAIGKIIHRNTKVPAMAFETFTTHVEGQRNVLIHILQGEREMAQDCRSLGRFDLKGLPAMPAGLPKIQVTFLVDANGILTVKAKELATQTEAAIEVKPSYGLTDDQVETMLQQSFDHAEEDLKNRQLVDTRVKAEGILRAAEKILQDAAYSGIEEGVTGVRTQIAVIERLSRGIDYLAIKTELEKLEDLAKPIAEKVMNAALQMNLKNKSVSDLNLKKDK